eukprot:1288778-Prymnesium_polylepis.1
MVQGPWAAALELRLVLMVSSEAPVDSAAETKEVQVTAGPAVGVVDSVQPTTQTVSCGAREAASVSPRQVVRTQCWTSTAAGGCADAAAADDGVLSVTDGLCGGDRRRRNLRWGSGWWAGAARGGAVGPLAEISVQPTAQTVSCGAREAACFSPCGAIDTLHGSALGVRSLVTVQACLTYCRPRVLSAELA